MSDSRPAVEGTQSQSRIRNPQDFYGGLVLIVLGLLALWASSDLPGRSGFAFGPGTTPRLFAGLLVVIGIAVSATGVLSDGPPVGRFAVSGPLSGALLVVIYLTVLYFQRTIAAHLPPMSLEVVVAIVSAPIVVVLALVLSRFAPRGPLFIAAAIVVFAATVRPLGLAVSSFVTIMMAAGASDEVHWGEAAIVGAVLALGCCLLFSYALGLPLPVLPSGCQWSNLLRLCR